MEGTTVGPLAKACRRIADCMASAAGDEIVDCARDAVAELVSSDDWLDDAWAQPDASRYQQHLLYLDPQSRFSIVSFVWSPGQLTPVHDHGTWGVVGVLRGAETEQRYEIDEAGKPVAIGEPRMLSPGDVEVLLPAAGDIHKVANALADRVSISIHAYGADIGRWPRRVFEPDGQVKEFISGYSSQPALLASLDKG